MGELIQWYVERKNEPSNVDGLLDFIQQLYIHGTIPIQEYRTLFREIDKLGAEKPEYYFEKQVSV
ncbi:YppF family protein [Pueribacillus theae]|nr:YppF family protein [Pueribacillus theae]